ncbi:hypothetical protein [uncultured Psychroserpens sp.]|uniref:LolA family protein n=1 Tax=uncultured Psychroserpens sp. TaxID=255436 RepID=UPI0026211F24|nr:hypothetical protein [uncultured Psychroserpens sp.]
MKQLIATIIIMLWAFAYSNAQSFDLVIEKVVSKQNSLDDYKTELIYTIYNDSISMVKKDEQKSEFIKKGSDYYFKMGNSEIIITNSFFIKISHSEKMMLYSKMDKASDDFFKIQNQFTAFLEQFETKTIDDKGTYWECVLSKPTTLKTPFSKIILSINKKDHAVLKQVYFFNSSIEKTYDSSSKNTQNERLEVVQTNFQKSPKITNSVFSFEKYLKPNGNSYTNSTYTKDYKIFVQ